MPEQPNLKHDIVTSSVIVSKLSDVCYAQNLYAAFCNVSWYKQEMLVMLEGYEYTISWRSAGALVADLRNTFANTGEDYMNYYCSGIMANEDIFESSFNNKRFVSEGTVTPEIRKDLADIGWFIKEIY